ncbi:hypothetical protein [Ramlibacter sp. AN1133]|uniref:hypothetical protein n=1 Tax=Ramlibacter sp. AN1133 TaxID=3133429 RepID=UPI0030C38723
MLNQSTPAHPEPAELSTEERQALMEALYQRFINSGSPGALKPALLAKAAVMSDEELLQRMLQYEADGDTEIAAVLARFGLSELPIDLRLDVEGAARLVDPHLLRVQVSVSELRRFELDHFSVRDMVNFGSLRIELPQSVSALGYVAQDAGWPVPMRTYAVLTNGIQMEPLIAFEIECGRPGALDVAYRTPQMRLAALRTQVAQGVGSADTLSMTTKTDARYWLPIEAAAHGEVERPREA